MATDVTTPWGVRIAAVGTVGVAVHAAILGIDSFVLAPLDAAPHLTPALLEAALAATDWGAGRAFGLGVLALGVVVAVAGLVLTVRRSWRAVDVAAGYLTLLALGGPAGFVAGFSTSMTLADRFGGSGGVITPTGEVMRVVALAFAVAAVVATVVAASSAASRRAAQHDRDGGAVRSA